MRRRRPSALALALAGLLAAGCGGDEVAGGAAGAGARERGASPWAQDDRFVTLLDPCERRGHFDGDTSAMLPTLVGKLETGELEVQRNLREELARAGQPAVEELARLVDRHLTDPHGTAVLQNALGVLWLSDAPGAREVLARCLEHPAESVRAQAARGLGKHAAPQDYDRLLAALRIAAPAARGDYLTALHAADRERFAREVAGWIASGEALAPPVEALRLVALDADEDTAARLAPLADGVADLHARLYLQAALLRGGDEAALAALRARLADGAPHERAWVLEALELAGRPREALPALRDEDAVVRAMAIGLLTLLPQDREVHGLLALRLEDAHPDVRQAALKALLAVGDARGAERALAQLGGDRGALQGALLALRGSWERNPGLAERAQELLLARLAELEGAPLRERDPVLQALGQVPTRGAAQALLARARTGEEGAHGQSAHRYLVRAAGNTGPAGRAVLMQAWAEEADPARRVDLIEGASFGQDEATRAFLLEVVEAERATPWERLFAAGMLVRLGPAQVVAPVLKRVALRVTDAEVRPAFDCLLRRWYG